MATTHGDVKRKRMGAKKPLYAVITAENKGTFPTYGEVKEFSRFIALTEAIQTAEAKFYSDNALDDDMKIFKQCDLTFENDGLTHNASADVFGLKLNDTGELVYGGKNDPPYIGYVFYRELKGKGDKRYYEGVYYPKCKAFVPNSTDNTRGENITFKGDTVSMSAYTLDDEAETWKVECILETEAEAEAWCREKLGGAAATGE